MSPHDLADHPLQHKIHPDQQRSIMRGILQEIGMADVLLAYESPTTGHLTAVDGHLRKSLGDTPWPTVILDIDDAEAAYILAVGDEVTLLAQKDQEALRQLLHTVASGDSAVQHMLSQLAEHEGIVPSTEDVPPEHYSRLIQPPLYVPTGPQPPLSTLYATSRTDALLHAIATSSLPDDEKHFLSLAAHRHVIFHYKSIAEYYAHATPEMQRLMEDSALIILDFHRALELGYVQLAQAIAQQYLNESPNAD